MDRFEISVIKQNENYEHFLKERKPFILRGSSLGPCLEKWTIPHLSSAIGKESVKIHVSEEPQLDFIKKNFSYKTVEFGEFLKRASLESSRESKTEYLYLRSVGKDARKEVSNIKQQFPNIADDIIFPKFVPEGNIFSTVFRIASKGLSVWTHYDVMDNALIQVQGRKLAVLFPPTDALNLYLKGDKSEVIDINQPDFSKYPKFRNVQRHEGCLLPGDVLYIPALWFHNMRYEDFGIAVNVFWKELDPNLYDAKDLYGNKDHLPAQQSFKALETALGALSKLPQDYKQFYCLRLINEIQKKM